MKIKQAMTRVKAEIIQMDIRIGVCNYTILQAKLKEKSEQNRAVAMSYSDYNNTAY